MKRSKAQARWSWREVISLTRCQEAKAFSGTNWEWERNSCSPSLCLWEGGRRGDFSGADVQGWRSLPSPLQVSHSSLYAADAEVCFWTSLLIIKVRDRKQLFEGNRVRSWARAWWCMFSTRRCICAVYCRWPELVQPGTRKLCDLVGLAWSLSECYQRGNVY